MVPALTESKNFSIRHRFGVAHALGVGSQIGQLRFQAVNSTVCARGGQRCHQLLMLSSDQRLLGPKYGLLRWTYQ